MWNPFKSKPTEAELILQLATLLGDVQSVEITTEAAKQIFQELSKVDGILDYLKDTMVNDMKRHFSVPDGSEGDKERSIIRGGFSRTAYLRKQILDAMEK